MVDIESVNIVFGYQCTLVCAHCSNLSSPARDYGADEQFVKNVEQALQELSPKQVIFTGGEPTLYLPVIQRVLPSVSPGAAVTLTTNGHFATSLDDVSATLDQLERLDVIQLSYDAFHRSHLDSDVPRYLREYAQSRGCQFCIVTCISSAKDMLFVNELKRTYECDVIFQKVSGSGRARIMKTEFKYPAFDESVLDIACPNRKTLSILYDYGVTPCCANLIYNDVGDGYAVESVEALRSNSALSEITQCSFRERMKKYGISTCDLEPRLSDPCNLCEYIEKHRLEKC